MRKALLFMVVISIVILIFPACAAQSQVITGSGKDESRDFDDVDFTHIEVGYAFNVEVIKSDSFGISITMDDNIFDYLIVSKSGETLSIGLKPNNSYKSYSATTQIMMPDLYKLELSGATSGSIKAFSSTHDFIIQLSGASSLNMVDMETGPVSLIISGASYLTGSIITSGNAEFDLSGASSVTLSGSAYDLKANLSGASHMELDNLPVNNVDVNFSGASGGTINLDGTMDVNLTGASYLYYIGTPILGDLDMSGGSSIGIK